MNRVQSRRTKCLNHVLIENYGCPPSKSLLLAAVAAIILFGWNVLHAESLNLSLAQLFTSGEPIMELENQGRPFSDTDLACLAQPAPKSSRVHHDWRKCTIKVGHEFFEDPNTYETLPVTIPSDARVFSIGGGEFGQLCNKLGFYAGILRLISQLSIDVQRNTIFALPATFTPPIWVLDLAAFSSELLGVLVDCDACPNSKLHPPTILRCNAIIVQGKLYTISHRLFTVTDELLPPQLFLNHRPPHNGFMKEFTSKIQPQRAFKYLVEQIMQRRLLSTTQVSVGMHKRFMDHQCYPYMLQFQDYSCHPHANMRPDVDQLIRTFSEGELKDFFWNSKKPDGRGDEGYWLRKISAEDRRKFELTYPLLIPCNYSLDPTQVEVLKRDWPILFERMPIKILLATDRQTPASEQALRQIDFGTVHKLEDYDACFANLKFFNMLADMVAMSMTDLHMGNPVSSCDDIVVHWRVARGKRVGTSYPPRCYEGYYKQVSITQTWNATQGF